LTGQEGRPQSFSRETSVARPVNHPQYKQCERIPNRLKSYLQELQMRL